ncbi:MAG: hypothetical protein FWC01_04545 [Treponema sp.]|nr:hypothetical protein [Treponema sp.]MCL2238144.1 hypothetical protein [Treponema sp.]
MKKGRSFVMFFLSALAAGLLAFSCAQPLDDFASFDTGNAGSLPQAGSGGFDESETPQFIEEINNMGEIGKTVWIKDGANNDYEYGNLQAALDWLRTNAVNNGSYTVFLDTDEIIAPQTLNYGDINKNINITFASADNNEKQIRLANPGTLFQVGAFITLTLGEGITLKGRNDNNSGSLVSVQRNATFIMNDGSAVKDNASRSHSAVLAEGTFVMNGGTISGNRGSWGGGVQVSNSGKFYMTGGSITGNFAHVGGGVCIFGAVWSSGEFIMTGGIIGDNVAELNGGGIFSSQNVSKGKLVIGGNAVISGNSIMDNPFPGNGYGGGIYSSGFVTLQDNCIIENNSAKGGAGVYLTLHQGSIIEQALVMTGGTIRANVARDFGGGVALSVSSPYIQFHKTSGTIYGRDGSANANIVINTPVENGGNPAVVPKPKPNENDQGENDNSQGNNNNQGENGGNKKPNQPPVPDNNNVLSGYGQAIAIVEFNADNSFVVNLRKEITSGTNDALSSVTAAQSAGLWN